MVVKKVKVVKFVFRGWATKQYNIKVGIVPSEHDPRTKDEDGLVWIPGCSTTGTKEEMTRQATNIANAEKAELIVEE